IDDHVEYFFRVFLFDHLFGPWIYQLIFQTLFCSFHELLSQCYAYVEIGYVFVVLLTGDKFTYVRVIHPEYAHIGSSSRAALLHRLRRRVEYPHEADGTTGNTAGGIDRRTLG